MPNVEQAEEKALYLKELLKQNPYTPTEELNAQIAKRFSTGKKGRPGGVSRALIAKMRWDNHGISIGPAGRYFDRNGNLIQPPGQPKKETSKPETEKNERQERLASLIKQIREEMAAQNIKQAVIPLEGPISTVQTVTIRREVKL